MKLIYFSYESWTVKKDHITKLGSWEIWFWQLIRIGVNILGSAYFNGWGMVSLKWIY
jgi:hypothetical protein